jgi:hypothetical protein
MHRDDLNLAQCELASVGAIRSLLPLPSLRVRVPNAVGEQAIQIGKIWIAVDEEVQALAIVFAGPLASPHLPSRIIRIEVRTPERRPAAMRTAFNVASVTMAFTDGRAAIGTGSNCLAHTSPRITPAKRTPPANSARSPPLYQTPCLLDLAEPPLC